MPTVTFTDWDKSVCVEPGTTVLQAARQLGIELAAPCGGSGTCGKCRVLVNGAEAPACRTGVDADMAVALPGQSRARILTDGAGAAVTPDPPASGHLLAVDIGTTTVVCYLLSPAGQELAVRSAPNPQSAFGADVISRIRWALDGELAALTGAIRRCLGELMAGCCAGAGILPEQIGVICVVGNPCMQQLFLGISPANLAAVPFTPVLTSPRTESAAAIFPEAGSAVLLTVPDISGYVGADTLACVVASKLHEAQETTLLVDIGTNGEMVLAHGGRMAACSTAAGPALEGAGIRLLCDHVGITPAGIRRVILAGAFGSYLDPDNACRMGLLPPELSGRITAAGNLAGAGAKMMAANREQFALAREICRRVEFIELADMPGFQRTFAGSMML